MANSAVAVPSLKNYIYCSTFLGRAKINSMRKAIVAYDRNRAIGANNDVPWMGRMKMDIQRVRALTRDNAIIMGRKTFESIGHALPNRQNIVVTHRSLEVKDVTVVGSMDDAFRAVESGRIPFVFGGQQIYEQAMGSIDEIIATEIDTYVEDADAFFPELDPSWHETSREHHDADDDNVYPFDFVTYNRY
jgi:dihydrofolate reductase